MSEMKCLSNYLSAEDTNIFFLFSSCGCDYCVNSRQEDSLRHSRSRINSYRALASPSLIALSSKDPILTAFELSWELRRLFFAEHEFKAEYMVSKQFLFHQFFLNFLLYSLLWIRKQREIKHIFECLHDLKNPNSINLVSSWIQN